MAPRFFCCDLKYFWVFLATYLINPKPTTAIATERIVNGMFRMAIRTKENTKVVMDVTSEPMHWFIEVPKLSTSLVTRLMMSPLEDLSK